MSPKEEAKAREIRAMLDAAAAKAAAGPPKRKPGRPATGQVSPAERQAKKKAELERGGGRRISVNLPGESIGHIARIRERDGLLTDTDTILAALAWYASRRIEPHRS